MWEWVEEGAGGRGSGGEVGIRTLFRFRLPEVL